MTLCLRLQVKVTCTHIFKLTFLAHSSTKMKPSQPPESEGKRRCKSLLDQQVDLSMDLYAARACVVDNVELLKEMIEDLHGDTSAKGRGTRKKLRLSIESLERAVIPQVTKATLTPEEKFY